MEVGSKITRNDLSELIEYANINSEEQLKLSRSVASYLESQKM